MLAPCGVGGDYGAFRLVSLLLGVLSDATLCELSPTLEAMSARIGRPSIPPEKLLRALDVTPHVAQNDANRRRD